MTAVVGRERVLGELGDLLAAARTGTGSVALLTGEAGIGKSTVADALVAQARAVGVPVLIGRAVADEGAPAYWPWRRALDAPALGLSAGLLDADPGERAREAIAAVRFDIADRTGRALARAAATDGLLLLIEDVQWADEASVALLRHVCRDVADTRMLVLGTVRTPAPEPIDLPGAHVIRLTPFDVADVAASLAAIANGPVDPSWPPYVRRLSAGNPLFARELGRLLAAEDRLAAPAVDLPVPAELRRIALRRMASLARDGQELLGVASAIGDEVDLDLLRSTVDNPRLADLVAEAVAAGVLVEDAGTPGRLRFSHELVRRARYDELSRTERVGWHRRIADAMESAGYASARPGELARHRTRAAEDGAARRTAVEACRGAAAAAAGQLAFADALHWYDQAAALLDTGPDAGAGRGELLLGSADSAYRAGQFDVALDRCAAVAGIAERLGRPDLAVAAAVVVRGLGGSVSEPIVALCTRAEALLGNEDSARHALVLAQHAYALAAIDRTAQADELSRRAMPMAERSGDADALALAIHAWYEVNQGPDGIAARLAAGARLRTLGGLDTALWSFVWRIDAMLELGAIDMLDAEIVEMAALVERLGWPIARWHLLRSRAARAVVAARYADAERYARAAQEVAASTQDTVARLLFHAMMTSLMWRTGVVPEEYAHLAEYEHLAVVLPIGAAQIGLLHLAAGDTARATALLDRVRPQLAEHPHNSRWLATMVMAGELAALLDDRETAALCYARALPYEGLYANSATGCYGGVARALGVMAAATGDHEAADRHFTAAVTQERRVEAWGDAAVAQIDHAELLATRGDHERARTMAEAVVRTARHLGMPPLERRAAALLSPASGVRDDGLLTTREREIAGLVAEGLSNKAIAERLYLSERTVESHVRNVLTKLGLANRTQVAGWFMRTT